MPLDSRLRFAIILSCAFAAFLWWIHFLSWGFGWDLWRLGVQPQRLAGLIGILTAPFIHGDWEHLIANTLPVIILGSFLIYGHRISWPWALGLIWMISGSGVWLFGRGTVHYGASGIAHGLMFYLFVMGIFRRDRLAMAISMATFFLYGSMVITIFPREPGISWESHMFGAIGGLIAALLFFRLDPRPPVKTYSWEQEPEDEEDPVIGDLWKQQPPGINLDEADEFPLDDDDEERW